MRGTVTIRPAAQRDYSLTKYVSGNDHLYADGLFYHAFFRHTWKTDLYKPESSTTESLLRLQEVRFFGRHCGI